MPEPRNVYTATPAAAAISGRGRTFELPPRPNEWQAPKENGNGREREREMGKTHAQKYYVTHRDVDGVHLLDGPAKPVANQAPRTYNNNFDAGHDWMVRVREESNKCAYKISNLGTRAQWRVLFSP